MLYMREILVNSNIAKYDCWTNKANAEGVKEAHAHFHPFDKTPRYGGVVESKYYMHISEHFD